MYKHTTRMEKSFLNLMGDIEITKVQSLLSFFVFRTKSSDRCLHWEFRTWKISQTGCLRIMKFRSPHHKALSGWYRGNCATTSPWNPKSREAFSHGLGYKIDFSQDTSSDFFFFFRWQNVLNEMLEQLFWNFNYLLEKMKFWQDVLPVLVGLVWN